MTMTPDEIANFNRIRDLALQELAGYKGKRVSTYALNSLNQNAYTSSNFHLHDDDQYKFILRCNTKMFRKPDLTYERVNNIIKHTDTIRKYDPAKTASFDVALSDLKNLFAAAKMGNKDIATNYGKKHLTTKEAVESFGVLGIFKRSFFQSGSDCAFESAMSIIDRAIDQLNAKTFKVK